MKKNYYLFYYYTPKSHLETTKQAIFDVGAGQMGNYSCCAWETKGTGQFKPETGSNAYIGKKGKVSKVIEYKVETICPASKIKKIIQALKKSHPYEHPAFGALKLEEF
jgi:structural toxin protein (hemagglutinin/hemolysin) RtxA